uniref:50S ribosomal protein L10 n=1 Tax=Hemiselmis andersenii TaxID=464988 RepID=A0A7S0U7M7_HEMAN
MKTAALLALSGAAVASAFSPTGPAFGLQASGRVTPACSLTGLQMAKGYDEKEEIVNNVRDRLESATLIFSTGLEGINMPEINALRNSLPEGTNAMVIKNRLLKRAVRGSPWIEVNDMATQSNLWLVIDDDLQGSIKAFKKWGKETKKGDINGGIMEGVVYDSKGIDALGELPSKDELYAKIAGGIAALPTNLARLTKEAAGQKMARGVKLAIAPDS